MTLDDQGFLWLSSQRGLARVERSVLERSLVDRQVTPSYRSFGIHEGLPTEDTSGTTQPASWTMRDGSIWFATLAGVAIIQPRNLDRPRRPPQVIIEGVLADTVELREPGRIPAGTRNLAIRYTATSLIDGAKNRFRYRLAGIDDDFVDAGTRREAFYNDIPPGTYDFQVLAADAENVWNEEGATVTLTFEPFFYQTRLFFWSVVASLILALLAADRYRHRSVRRRQIELEEEVESRTREISLQKSLIEEQADELRLLDEAKSRFFANVTHELRTPLTLMIAPLQDWLGRGEANQAFATRSVSTALASAKRMNQLVDELMSFAKIESGAAHLVLRRDDIVAFLDRSWQGFVPLAESHDIHFTLHGPQEEILVDFDPAQLRFVIDNLLQNAFKFTTRGGEIDLEIASTASDEGSRVRFTVRDNGCGIAPEHQELVFQRFFQLSERHLEGRAGTGIGLSLVRDIAQLHGGDVELASELGRGSAFTVDLPGTESRAEGPSVLLRECRTGGLSVPPADAAESTEERISDDRYRILVVEDNPDVRTYVREILSEAYTVFEAETGNSGLELARREQPDLVVCDVMMPDGTGLEFVRGLRADTEIASTPVILLTAKAESDDTVQGLAAGADDYVTKPFVVAELHARIRGLIEAQHRLRTSLRLEGLAERAARATELHESPEDDFLDRLHRYIATRLDEPDLSWQDIASSLSMSRASLFREVKEKGGTSPGALIRRLRLRRAAYLLAHDSGSVGEVAYAVGFSCRSYFARAFKEHFGVAPSSFGQTAESEGLAAQLRDQPFDPNRLL